MVFEFESQQYVPGTDDLFLVYTAIDNSFNKNGWKVENIDDNIKTGLGRPGVIKPKDISNINDVKQEGQFVHPTFPGVPLQTLLQQQEAYTIARAVRLDKGIDGNWRVWLHVTDPKAKAAFQEKNASASGYGYGYEYPKYISPQVITFPADFPDEDARQSYKHWLISHWCFVDVPAYGEKMQVRGNCYGDLNDCKIKLQNAATANFCVKEAIRVLNSSSSVNSIPPTQSIMSESNAAQPITTGAQPVQQSNTSPITLTWQPVQPASTPTPQITYTTSTGTSPQQPQQQTQAQPSKQEPEPGSANRPGQPTTEQKENQTEPNQEEKKEAQLIEGLPKTIPELQKLAQTQSEIIKDLQKRFSVLEKDNAARKQNELRYAAASKVARYHSSFKSQDAFNKEVDNIVRYGEVMSEQEIEDYLRAKYSGMVPVAKSASTLTNINYDVPNFQQNNASSSSDNNRKLIRLVDMYSVDDQGAI